MKKKKIIFTLIILIILSIILVGIQLSRNKSESKENLLSDNLSNEEDNVVIDYTDNETNEQNDISKQKIEDISRRFRVLWPGKYKYV